MDTLKAELNKAAYLLTTFFPVKIGYVDRWATFTDCRSFCAVLEEMEQEQRASAHHSQMQICDRVKKHLQNARGRMENVKKNLDFSR